jgi:cytidine deaminase
MIHQELIEKAKGILGEFQLAQEGLTAGSVSSALMTSKGNIYTGICLDLSCGIGFCAEHAAIAEMLKARETAIEYIVAVKSERILMPCGRCRELMLQVDKKNLNTKVVIDDKDHIVLSELLPKHWM